MTRADSKTDGLRAVRQIANEHPGILRANDYEENRDAEMPPVHELVYEYGSWVRVANEAGITSGHSENGYTASGCAFVVEAVAHELGETPTRKQYSTHKTSDMPCASTVVNRLGSWNRALEAADVQIIKSSNTTSSDCLSAIEQTANAIKKPPTPAEYEAFRDLVAERIPSSETILKTFEEDWGSILARAGHDSPKEYSERELVTRNGTSDAGYGSNWRTQRDKARERDNWECVVCGLDNGEHKQRYGKGLEVHHIKPFDEFESPEEANRLENLVTVCCSCHGTLQQMEVERQKNMIGN